jgi:hypothetical protein
VRGRWSSSPRKRRALRSGEIGTGHLLLAMLGLGGASAELLRQHGLDEAAVRGALGGP